MEISMTPPPVTFEDSAYMEPAPLSEILQEQLEYLIAHSAHPCTPGCADCARFQRVVFELLLPFRCYRRVRPFRYAA
jgi:hypothetical protein